MTMPSDQKEEPGFFDKIGTFDITERAKKEAADRQKQAGNSGSNDARKSLANRMAGSSAYGSQRSGG